MSYTTCPWRFILSLASCPVCVVMDDHLRVLPISSHLRDLQPVPPASTSAPLSPQEQELKELKESLKENPPIGLLIDLCKTLDQVSFFSEVITIICLTHMFFVSIPALTDFSIFQSVTVLLFFFFFVIFMKTCYLLSLFFCINCRYVWKLEFNAIFIIILWYYSVT